MSERVPFGYYMEYPGIKDTMIFLKTTEFVKSKIRAEQIRAAVNRDYGIDACIITPLYKD